MAANNGGGRQGNNQMNGEHVEFSVKAEEDLYLTGSENTIRRVTAETNYSCLMLKTQRFSSLFRHYAKYHGLRKDDLEYYFVNLLGNDDTPETVQLQRGDTIMVRKRRKPEPPDVAADDKNFFKDMKELLYDDEHMDAIFVVTSGSSTNDNNNNVISMHMPGTIPLNNNNSTNTVKPDYLPSNNTAKPDYLPSNNPSKSDNIPANNEELYGKITSAELPNNRVEIRAHKSVLTARGEYFKALFRTNADQTNKTSGASFRESEECIVTVEPQFTETQIRYVLEFIYTNRIDRARDISTDDLLCLLQLADRWLLRDMKRYVEHELMRSHLSTSTVARMYGATEKFAAQRLSRACFDFIMCNLRELAGDPAFLAEMQNYPLLCIPILKAAAEVIPEGPVHKKQRTDHHTGATPTAGTPSSGPPGLRSSPVPDSDT